MSVGMLISLAVAILGIIGASLVAWALHIVGRAVASVAGVKLKGWLPHIAAVLVAWAVARLPKTERERYWEEWFAELLAYQESAITALMFSVGVRRRVGDLVKELPGSPAPDLASTASPAPTAATAG